MRSCPNTSIPRLFKGLILSLELTVTLTKGACITVQIEVGQVVTTKTDDESAGRQEGVEVSRFNKMWMCNIYSGTVNSSPSRYTALQIWTMTASPSMNNHYLIWMICSIIAALLAVTSDTLSGKWNRVSLRTNDNNQHDTGVPSRGMGKGITHHREEVDRQRFGQINSSSPSWRAGSAVSMHRH